MKRFTLCINVSVARRNILGITFSVINAINANVSYCSHVIDVKKTVNH